MKRKFLFKPKGVLAAFATLALVLGASVAAQATFGPDRPTYTMAVPADHVTFNSITDNPAAGDERQFVKGARPGAASFSDPVTGAQDGEEITVQIYVHNDAAANLNLNATNTMVKVALPTGSKQQQTITGTVSADNAAPTSVFDTLDITGANNGFMELAYVPGSASYKNNKGTFTLPDTIVTSGAKVGYDQMNGVFPGCAEFSGWVTLRVKVNMPHYVVQKSARLAGEGADKWRESVNAKLGDTIEWRIEVRNIGSTTLNNIIVLDELPPYMTVEPGTVKLINGNYPSTNPYVYPASAIQQKNGLYYVNVDAGSYLPNSNGFVRFSSKIVSDPKISCDNQKLTNKAYATPKGYGTVSSYAYVIVVNDKPCDEEKPKPLYSCDALNVESFDGRKIKATVSYTAKDGAVFKDVVYNFGDSTNNLVTNKTSVEHTYANDGTYTVAATVNFTVDGKTVTSTSDACKKVVTFKGETPVTPPTNPEVPETLPNTGTESVLGLFMGVSILGAVGHRLWTLYRS